MSVFPFFFLREIDPEYIYWTVEHASCQSGKKSSISSEQMDEQMWHVYQGDLKSRSSTQPQIFFF